MARPTIAAQLKKAITDGDLEKAKLLAEKLEAPKVKTTKPKAKKTTKKAVKVYEEEIYVPEDLVDEEEDETTISSTSSDFIAQAKSKNGPKKQSYINEDGEERVRCKVVPFKVIKNRKNLWEDDLTQELADIKFDEKVHANKNKKRQYREPTNKVKVICSRCGQKKSVWPGEVTHKNWACDQCLIERR